MLTNRKRKPETATTDTVTQTKAKNLVDTDIVTDAIVLTTRTEIKTKKKPLIQPLDIKTLIRREKRLAANTFVTTAVSVTPDPNLWIQAKDSAEWKHLKQCMLEYRLQKWKDDRYQKLKSSLNALRQQLYKFRKDEMEVWVSSLKLALLEDADITTNHAILSTVPPFQKTFQLLPDNVFTVSCSKHERIEPFLQIIGDIYDDPDEVIALADSIPISAPIQHRKEILAQQSAWRRLQDEILIHQYQYELVKSRARRYGQFLHEQLVFLKVSYPMWQVAYVPCQIKVVYKEHNLCPEGVRLSRESLYYAPLSKYKHVLEEQDIPSIELRLTPLSLDTVNLSSSSSSTSSYFVMLSSIWKERINQIHTNMLKLMFRFHRFGNGGGGGVDYGVWQLCNNSNNNTTTTTTTLFGDAIFFDIVQDLQPFLSANNNKKAMPLEKQVINEKKKMKTKKLSSKNKKEKDWQTLTQDPLCSIAWFDQTDWIRHCEKISKRIPCLPDTVIHIVIDYLNWHTTNKESMIPFIV